MKKNEKDENIKNIRNRKVYEKKDTDDKYDYDFWHNHYIWCFDFYVTKKWRYEEWYTEEYFKLIHKESNSSLCYICERELKGKIFYLTDYHKKVSIGKCCIKRYIKPRITPHITPHITQHNTIKRFKLKEE